MFESLRTARFNACAIGFAAVFSVFIAAVARGGDDQPENEDFFESKVRPLLVDRCVECHGADEQAGLLRLDRPAAANRTVGSGPLLTPGNAERSLIIRAVRYEDSNLQMPPDEKLSDEQIATLETWVSEGAYWPSQHDGSVQNEDPLPASQQFDRWRSEHWSYHPFEPHEPPSVNDTQWPRQPIDFFVLSKLEHAGLAPNPQASRRTLIRRAYFALIGLPPTYQEVEEFVADESPDAFENLVDRLLENEHYGERWARHWLDLARFAETKGYLAGAASTTYPYAYTYRDYVINAFNQDKPFDRFIIEQIAADQLDLPEDDKGSLAALGFLTVGRKFMGNPHDIIDDQIDVVTRGFLAQSVACARCHDHKYDPIPSSDYYSLYGVFASSHEPSELPLISDPSANPHHPEFLAAKAEKQREIDAFVEEKRIATQNELRSRISDYLVYLAKTLPNSGETKVPESGPRGALRPSAIQRWREYVNGFADQPHPVWGLWHALASIDPSEFSTTAQTVLGNSQTDDSLTRAVAERLEQASPKSMPEAAQVIGEYLESIIKNWIELQNSDAAATRLVDDDQEKLRSMLYDAKSPTSLDSPQTIAHLNQAERDGYNQQLGKIKTLELSHPGAPARAMALVDQAQPVDPVIFVRGQPGNRGEAVPRRFLQILDMVQGGRTFTKGSGRLELAQAIASPKNPLTARVIVNRIWQQHFGNGLVRSSSDFGVRGEQPTHPELLDTLTADFVAHGWSIKRLQRNIMLSATWQQSSTVSASARQTDPENRLLSFFPRRRLEFEPLRDSVLSAAGKLDLTVGGRSVMIHQDGLRRALYAYIDREDVPGLLAIFDVPSPDASQAIRSRTTVPQQALYLINSPFAVEQARSLAALTAHESSSNELNSDAERIVSLYRRTLSRDPDVQELTTTLAFIQAKRGDESDPKIDPWVELAQVMLASNEFACVD